MPTTMETETVALLERIKTDPFHTPTVLSEAQQILDVQLHNAGDKNLSFLDKDSSMVPFINDVVRSMDMREDIHAFLYMHVEQWYTIEAFSRPLSLTALFLAKYVTIDRKLPGAIKNQLQVRGQMEIARWLEESDKFAEELASFESGRGVSVPSKLFRHARAGRHDHHDGFLKDPRPLVETGYEFRRDLLE